MTRKSKIRLIVVSIIAVFLILFVPIPTQDDLGYGTAFSLNSLTYKVIFWDLYENTEKPYTKTELILSPDNFSSASKIFEQRRSDLENEGYGAVSVVVSVEKIENNRIWTKELSDDKNAINDVVISFNSIEKYGKNIATEDIKEDILLKITNNGIILESYPALFNKIYSIEIVNSKTTETIINKADKEENNSVTQSNNTSGNSSNQQVSSSTETTSSNTNSQNTQSTVSNNTSSTVSTTDDDDFVPIFWSQTIHRNDNNFDTISEIDIPYLVVEPHNYDPSKKYPVILFLHGAGERYYSINDPNYNQSQASAFANSYIFSFEWLKEAIIVAPQISINDWWNFGYNSNDGTLDAAMRIFEKVTKEYSCDSSRYYVTGLSMGGYGTWQVASKYSDTFAAAMPLCGWWNPQNANSLTDIPIRIMHGTDDKTVSANQSIIMQNAIVNAGGQKSILKLYEDVDHDVWTYAYADTETWEWLFSQRKK